MPVSGLDSRYAVDAIFVNAPLKNYDDLPRRNDVTLPVLGLGYIATYARSKGFNVGVLDVEALGIGISEAVRTVLAHRPRWIGLNLLAPTYQNGVDILGKFSLVSPDTLVMLGGHHAKAMPDAVLADSRIPRIDALVIGEAESRVVALLGAYERRDTLPGVRWRTGAESGQGHCTAEEQTRWLAPDVDALPFVDRQFLVQDPFLAGDGRREANIVGSRGCPYECSFCGAAISSNPDVTIRTRSPANILGEMAELATSQGVTAFRFVDDLFLSSPSLMRECLTAFWMAGIGDRFVWDATSRINTIYRSPPDLLDLMVPAGCREISLGIESGSERLLRYMGKRITPPMILQAVSSLLIRGINVKGYFILGFPTESARDLAETARLIQDLWNLDDKSEGRFRCSIFEFRPYPGTLEWNRLIASGRYSAKELLQYEQVDLTDNGALEAMADRDEFNFSVNRQFGEVSTSEIRNTLTQLTIRQKSRKP